MPTLTIRNVPPKVVAALKAQAKQHHRSMEQVRESWDRQSRRPDAAEVQAWLDASRP
jgi:plasmid stability protein